MKKLPPSKRMSKAMRELLEQGTEGYIPREFLRLGKQLSIKGELELLIPQVRQAPEPFIPKVAQFFKGHTDLLDRLVVEMHTRGLSTRDIEDTLVMLTGEKVLSSASVSRVSEALWKEYQAFSERDLYHIKVGYLFLGAIYESLRSYGDVKEAVLY